MLDDIIKSNLGAITVETEQNRGHSPEWWAERLTERICGISENAAPHVRQQAEAFKLAIYETILYHIKQAINSERCTMANLLRSQGHEDLAKILKEL
jgi:primosomal protein N''